MIKRNNMKLTAMALMLGMSLFVGCGSAQTTTEVKTEVGQTEENTTNSIAIEYEKDDYYTAVNTSEATQINLGDTIQVTGTGVSVQETTATITNGGTYVISGNLKDGQIIIDCETSETVRLVLSNANITSSNSAPIYAKQVEKLVVSLEQGTENTLVDASEYVYTADSDEPSGTIFSKGDLTINGTGTLVVNANYKDAIVSKDSLKIMEGNLIINAVDDGIVGKDMVAIKDGNITITSGGDGIKSTNTQGETVLKGFVYIENGTFNITAEGDGIQAETSLEILDGKFNILTGGGSDNGRTHTETMMNHGGMKNQRPSNEGQMPPNNEGQVAPSNEGQIAPSNEGQVVPSNEGQVAPSNEGQVAPSNEGQVAPSNEGQMPTDNKRQMPPTNEGSSQVTSIAEMKVSETQETTETQEQTISTKAVKANDSIVIRGGEFSINSADDAIHGNNEIVIEDGSLEIETGDDGIHADKSLTINGGSINITKSYEGLEAEIITINDGEINVVASDDGINAAEASATEDSIGDLMHSNGNAELIVNGGKLYVNASGDGLDANGSITINDGTIIVDGPTNGGNGALDYDTTCNVNGGMLIAAGSAQMAQTASTTSTINTVNMTFSQAQEAGQTVSILDEAGKVVVAFKSNKAFQVISISSPKLETGKTYTCSYGGNIDGTITNGVDENCSYTGGTSVTEFTISEVVTYLNESGVTTASSGMGGHGQGGFKGPRNSN